MGEIRSALDIALEKTSHIESDKKSSQNRELKNIGKKAGGDFLEQSDISVFQKVLENKNDDEQKILKEGAISILLALITLPTEPSYFEKLKTLSSAFDYLIPNSGMNELFAQVEQIINHYLGERENVKQMLEKQFMPKLQQKQQEFEKRYGKSIPLNLEQDHEYVATLGKTLRSLENKYSTVVTEVRHRIKEAAHIED